MTHICDKDCEEYYCSVLWEEEGHWETDENGLLIKWVANDKNQ